jgi:hypothetical protein
MINSNFGFTPLKEVWLGDCYPETYYDHLPNEIADPLSMITEWTKQDTARLQKFLENRGIIVRRPVFSSIDDYVNDNGYLCKPPVTPRDHYLVLDQTLYSLRNFTKKDPWDHWLTHYKNSKFDVQIPKDQPVNCLHPPCIVRMGRDLYIDIESHERVWGYVSEWMVNMAKNYRINICSTGGHSDGVFCPINNGVIVSSHYKTDYTQSFPNWKIYMIPEQYNNFNNAKDWLLQDSNINQNMAFSAYIQNNARDWIGKFQETVFEVNMLVLDEHNVVSMKDYPPLTRYLEEMGIQTHVFDLRTRSFWDGGWHCFTLDICRDDRKLDLFPQRGDNGVYWRLL